GLVRNSGQHDRKKGVLNAALAEFRSGRLRFNKRFLRHPGPSGERKLFFKSRGFQTVTVGRRHQSIFLECEAGGSPTPTIHWLKDGQRLTQGAFETVEDDTAAYEDLDSDQEASTGDKLRLSATKSRLYLDCLTDASEGEYTCVAETPFMRKTQSTIVKVEGHGYPSDNCIVKRSARGEPARVYMWTASRLEYEDSTVQLFCRASGTPDPVITWYDSMNNTIPDDSEQFSVAVNGDLIIRDISWFNNMGVYRCMAENQFGSQLVETFLYP
ncbi:hypothetical protein BaRGS_00022850, partial [Batillaria attramentaria]